ncbi:unnamed protein product [Urochloa humidicola]
MSLNSRRPATTADEARLKVSCRSRYTSLRHLNITDTGVDRSVNLSIPMLMFEAGSMPKLETLYIHIDADITISVTNGRLDFGLQHLSHLTSFSCFVYGSKINALRVKAAIGEALYGHPNAPDVRIQWPSICADYFRSERLKPRRRWRSTTSPAQPTRPFVADLTEQRLDKEAADEHLIMPSAHKRCRFTIDDNTTSCSFVAALPLPTDLSFTVQYHDDAPIPKPASSLHHRNLGAKQRRRSSIPHQGQEHPALHQRAPDNVIKGTEGASPASGVLGPGQTSLGSQLPCFIFSAGSSTAAAQQELARQDDVPSVQSPPAPPPWNIYAFGDLSLQELSNNESIPVLGVKPSTSAPDAELEQRGNGTQGSLARD